MLFVAHALADFILTAPPRESLQKGRAEYDPIAKAISKLIGKKVIYQQPRNWFDYSIKMRSGAYDIVFDGPHFAAWRIKHSRHVPVVSLPGNLKFVLLTDRNNDSINNLDDISEMIMCGMLAPNLGTGMIMSQYPDPDTQPMIYESRGFTDVFRNFQSGECHVAIMRDKAYNKLAKNDKRSIKIIHTTAALPNQTVTIGPNMEKYINKIRKFLTSSAGSRIARKLLIRFSKKNPIFIRARIKKYRGLEVYLQGSDSKW